MKMTVDQIREYLRDKIDNSWYYNARIDYGVSGRFLDVQAYGDQLQHLRITWEEDGKRYASVVSWWTEYTAEQVYNIWMEEDEPEEIPAEPTGTQSIKFFWNGIKINGEKKLIRCFYSLDNRHDGRECVTIYARDYSGHLPGDMFSVENGTDSMTDYFETDHASLFPGHPLYRFARAAAILAEFRQYRQSNQNYSFRIQKLYEEFQTLPQLPKEQPTTADVEAVHALNLAAETARLAAEKEKEQKELEAVLSAQNEGRHYIEEVAAAHPIQEGAPVVTIEWSEHPAFYSWEDGELKLSVAAAEIVFRHFDDERAERNAAEGHGGYDKTSFAIEYTADDGERHTYEGRYDLGDNDGGLIAHIRAFAESCRDKRLPYHSEEDASQISAIADLLEAHTAAGRVVSVSVAPWFEKAVRERQKAAEEAKREEVQNIMDAVEMLTDQQLAAAVLHVPVDDAEKADVARFFLQALARRDEKKALSVFKAWRSGAGLEFLDEI